MQRPTTAGMDARYGHGLVALHWLTLLLIAAGYACIELREFYPRGSGIREGLKDWHYALGLVVFALTLVRIALRLSRRAPPITPPLARWQAGFARAVHFVLYAFMIAMPLLGWLVLSAEGKPPGWFGLTMPSLIGVDENLASELEELHETIGVAGYWIIGVHAAVALFHHYFVRDDTLRRMLPRRSVRAR